MSVGYELLNVPFADMVSGMAVAIARSQAALDMESIEILREMCNKEANPVTLPYLRLENGKLTDNDITTSMIGAGFQPSFYQFAETIIEVKMAITVTNQDATEKKYSGNETRLEVSTSRNRRGSLRRLSVAICSTPVDATYTNKYNYTQEGSSLLRTRLVPVPPNPIIQQQLELRAQAVQLEYQLQLKQYELAIAQKQQEVNKALEELGR